MLVVTSNELPGYEIRRVLGEVFGVTVREMGFGGKVARVTDVVLEGRYEAMNRLVAEAHRRGGNAVVAMRFHTGSLATTLNAVCAYGTAVWAEPVTEEAQAQYAAMVAAGQVPALGHGGPPPAIPGPPTVVPAPPPGD